jgi:membrane protease YdiL (CAAX protease family)
MMVIAGFGEETVFRGYLSDRFGKLLGHSAAAKTFTVLTVGAGAGSDLRNQCGLILSLNSENDLVAVR